MSFASPLAIGFATPLALLCLAAVPLALLAHSAAQHRRRRYPVRYTALSTLAAVAGADHIVLSTQGDWLRALGRALR